MPSHFRKGTSARVVCILPCIVVFQFVCVVQADYYRILTQGEKSIQCIEENGKVVMVTEFRKTDGGSRQGHVVIKVSGNASKV